MKILTILGTRPEIIRLSRIITKLDTLVDHKIVHTGQNYDSNLNDIFFNELDVRTPDYTIDSKSSTLSEQLGKMFHGVETILKEFNPDKVLILGDTNSGLCAILCERLGYPVYHMEAGNRCYDLKVPEEKNRKLIDSISSYNLPYTNLSRENLLREGVSNNKIIVIGNPIYEVLNYYNDKIKNSKILDHLQLEPNRYIIVTAHRAENVDIDNRLNAIFTALNNMAEEYRVIFSCHPRTKEKLVKFNVNKLHSNIIMSEPFGFFDFVQLEKNSLMAVTDSGTVQEEMCLFKIPTITIRDSTERPETVWCGSNIVTGLEVDNIMLAYKRMKKYNSDWNPPIEYTKNDVSETVLNVLMSK